MKRVIMLGIIMVFAAVGGCKKPTPISVNNPKTYYIGEDFVLKYNECKTLVDTVTNKNYKICILDSVKDGRCPLSTCFTCFGIWPVQVKIRWITEVNDTAVISLSLWGCYTNEAYCGAPDSTGLVVPSKDTLGHRFCLLKVSPHPDTSNIPIAQEDYRIKLKITKP